MRILYLGDVVGRSGRQGITKRLAGLRERLRVDFAIVNGENATSGAGLSPEHASDLLNAGADVLTLGDHAFDRRELMAAIDKEPRIIRPLNFSKAAPGAGARIFDAPSGKKVLVAQVLGQVFMKRPFDDPFSAVETVLKTNPLGGRIHASVIDVHCEATSEKMAMGHFCDGRASLVVGSHTHVPTGDAMILGRGTGYMTDGGMCGDYNSVIGMDKEEPLRRFLTGMSSGRFQPANGEATLSGVLVETDDKTGLATHIEPVRDGGQLSATP